MNYKQHPLSAAFPAMDAADYQALVADIRQHGQRDVATLADGMVIDGWHRYSACLELGIPCRFEEFAGTDAVAFVLSKNLHRRQLTASQRAAAVTAAASWVPPHRPKKGEPGSPLLTNAQMAEAAGVDVRTIQQAKRAQEAGLGEAVRDGKVSAKQAAEISKLPEPERAAAIEAPKPKPAKPESIPCIADVQDRVKALESENAELREQLAEMAQQLESTLDDVTSLSKVVDSNEPVQTALGEAKRFREENRVLNERLTGMMNERNEHIRIIKGLRRKLEKLGQAAA